jgi:hypothetical protein
MHMGGRLGPRAACAHAPSPLAAATPPARPQAWRDVGGAAATPGGRPWLADVYGWAFAAAEAGLRHVAAAELVLYPGQPPSAGPPRALHYGLRFAVGRWWGGAAGRGGARRAWPRAAPHASRLTAAQRPAYKKSKSPPPRPRSFDRHWFAGFDPHRCPPWGLGAARPRDGVFPPPPHPDSLRPQARARAHRAPLSPGQYNRGPRPAVQGLRGARMRAARTLAPMEPAPPRLGLVAAGPGASRLPVTALTPVLPACPRPCRHAPAHPSIRPATRQAAPPPHAPPPKDFTAEHRDLLAVHAGAAINAALCDYHARSCPASEELSEVCGAVSPRAAPSPCVCLSAPVLAQASP